MESNVFKAHGAANGKHIQSPRGCTWGCTFCCGRLEPRCFGTICSQSLVCHGHHGCQGWLALVLFWRTRMPGWSWQGRKRIGAFMGLAFEILTQHVRWFSMPPRNLSWPRLLVFRTLKIIPSSWSQEVWSTCGSWTQLVILILENTRTRLVSHKKSKFLLEPIIHHKEFFVAGKKPFGPTTGEVAAKELFVLPVDKAGVNHFIYAGCIADFSCGEWGHFGFWQDFGLWSHGCLGQWSEKTIWLVQSLSSCNTIYSIKCRSLVQSLSTCNTI